MSGLLVLALRNITRNPGRTALTLGAIVFGVVAQILSGGFIEDTVVEVGESMIHSWSGHLQVSRQGYQASAGRAPEAFLIDRPEDLRTSLLGEAGVDDVLLRIGFSGLISNGRSDWAIVGEGVEADREARLGSYVTIAAGRRLRADDCFGMMIGQGVARTLKLAPGDPVTLLVTTAGGAANVLEFRIVGVFQTFSKDYDARAVLVPLAAAQELLATKGVHVAVIRLARTGDSAAGAGRLAPRLRSTGLELRTWVQLNEFYEQTVRLYQRQFGFLIGVVFVMMVLSVANTVNMNIFERVAEFGTMLAVGTRPDSVFRLIVAESLLLGLVGAALGATMGVALALQISAIGIPMPPPPNAELGYTSRILVVPAYVGLAFASGLVATVAASIPSARHVSRTDVAEALRQAI